MTLDEEIRISCDQATPYMPSFDPDLYLCNNSNGCPTKISFGNTSFCAKELRRDSKHYGIRPLAPYHND